jgi:hypothetical protein
MQRDQNSSPGRPKIVLLSISSRPALGSIQLPIQWIPGALSSGVKRLWLQAESSPSSNVEFKNDGSLPPLPHTLSWHGALLLVRILKFLYSKHLKVTSRSPF